MGKMSWVRPALVALVASGCTSSVGVGPQASGSDTSTGAEPAGSGSTTGSGATSAETAETAAVTGGATDADSAGTTDASSQGVSSGGITETGQSGSTGTTGAVEPGPSVDTFWDDFEDGVIGPGWNAPECTTGCTVDESSGSMRFSMDGSGACSCRVQSADAYSLTGQAVLLDVPAITNFHPPLRCFVAVADQSGDFIEYGFDGADVFYAEVALDGAKSYAATSTYPPRPRYWRIREDAGQIYFESSGDAATWEVELQTSTPFSVANVQVSFGVYTSASMPSSINISIPNFNIVP
jgi:hypothetical protein